MFARAAVYLYALLFMFSLLLEHTATLRLHPGLVTRGHGR